LKRSAAPSIRQRNGALVSDLPDQPLHLWRRIRRIAERKLNPSEIIVYDPLAA
jgi:hypothetical protein